MYELKMWFPNLVFLADDSINMIVEPNTKTEIVIASHEGGRKEP